MTEMSSPHQTTAPVRQPAKDESSTQKISLVPYDENLLERVRTQWQFGDWRSLSKLTQERLQHHPDRAKLALLSAAGKLQLGLKDEAKPFLRLAIDWGIDKRLIARILIAGVHNSLGRASIIGNQQQLALQHFEDSITIGTPESDIKLLTQARTSEQKQQINNHRHSYLTINNLTDLKNINHNNLLLFPIDISMLLSQDEEVRRKELNTLHQYMTEEFFPLEIPSLAFTSIIHENRRYYFVHFACDYIPKKISTTGKFYEQTFLSILEQFYIKDSVVIDCGANIGNHSIYFSGVMNAKVLAFEPQPYNNLFLNINRKLNGLEDSIISKDIALSCEPGQFSLAMAIEENYGSFTSDLTYAERTRGTKLSEKFEVIASTIDDELSNSSIFVSIIKIDVEGMELSILKGSINTIIKYYPVITVECLNKNIYNKIKNFLKKYNYFTICSTNATPTFIFLTQNNLYHTKILLKYIENSSIGKFDNNYSFNNTE